MFLVLLLSFISYSFQHECGVGPDWQPDLKQYPHEGRSLESGLNRDTHFKPLRIHFEYSALTLTEDQLSILQNEIIPPVQHWFQSVLSVNPLINNLINPFDTCNGLPVPSLHKTKGISDTDFIIYLNNEDSPFSNFIAYAAPCLIESRGRFNVLAGSFTINVYYFYNMPRYQQIGVAIHELTHDLAFSPSLYNWFVKPDGSRYKQEEIFKTVYYPHRGKSSTLLILPTVAEKAREIYGCETVEGLELEDYGSSSAGAHWEMKIVIEDYMVSVFPDFPSYSNLTLALFQDSGWYKVDFSYAQPITIGKNEGCERFEEKCITGSIVQAGFCTKTNTCDYTRTTPTRCDLYNYYEGIPSNYQYFQDPIYGGGRYSDYCPLMYSNQKRCRDNNENYDTSYGWKYGYSSRCFESSLVLESAGQSPVFAPSCYEVIRCEEDKVVVGIGDQNIDCPFSGGAVTVPGYDGYLHCPDSSICDEIVPCLNSCYGQGKCDNGVCRCDEGFGGKDCSIVCVGNCKSCNDLSSCTSCYSIATLENGVCYCPDGATWDDTQKVCMPGTIIGCPKECNGCADETTCAACYGSMTLNDKNLCECPSGTSFNVNSNTCETIIGCSDSCNGCDTPQACLSCYDTATLQNGDCICPDGHYFNPETKTCDIYITDGCSLGCQACQYSGECAKCTDENAIILYNKCFCKKGYYEDESLGSANCHSNFYIECNDDCTSCTSLESCTSCDDPLMTPKADGSCICPDGYYGLTLYGFTSCYKCVSGCKICDSEYNCLECTDPNGENYDSYCGCKIGYFNGWDQDGDRICLRKGLFSLRW
ncbi:WIF1_3 [Blepharisma stoltei]|uniref:EGF-like domain-containing protein n=1 Tax=Blepharisma stoltei TaxID=1481888 RepID=A0AAU9IXW7_9CILI|nr:unnamed protein product [Blepharisma stoltei]